VTHVLTLISVYGLLVVDVLLTVLLVAGIRWLVRNR
jgi:hypothetical protein